jgi:magnesium transporter
MDEDFSKKVLKNVDKEARADVSKILKYSENKAGYHMSLNFVTLKESITIKSAKAQISKQIRKEDAELAGNILLNDNEGKLTGSISIEDIMSQSENKRLKSFKSEIKSIHPDSSIKEARDLIADYNLDSLPVVEEDDTLLGIIEPEDMIEVLADIEEKHLSFVSGPSRVKRGKKVKEYKPYGKLTSIDIFKTRLF